MQSNYSVTIDSFTERHFIKSFEKKYKQAWDVALIAITDQFERIDNLLNTPRAEIISSFESIKIIKTEFRIPTTKESAKTSGNRCIIAVDEKIKHVSILLVYCKTDIEGSNETAWWKRIIKVQYPEYKAVLA